MRIPIHQKWIKLKIRKGREGRNACDSKSGVKNGVKENRTPDLLLAKQALYQLSYNPGSVDATM
jgi:hypothetical protein